jgi:hypothetical protein
MKKPPPVRTGRGLLDSFSSYPLRCEHAYTYHDYGPYDDFGQEVGGVAHVIPSSELRLQNKRWSCYLSRRHARFCVAGEILRLLARCSKKKSVHFSAVTGMLSVMEQTKTVDQSKAASLSARGTDRYPHRNQSVLMHFVNYLGEFSSHIFHSLLNHLLATDCYRMVVIKKFGTRVPVVPLRLVIPWYLRVVAEQESQRTGYLPEPPFTDMGISPDIHQPQRYSISGMRSQLNIRVGGEKSFHMRQLPENRSWRDAKIAKGIRLFAPKKLLLQGQVSLLYFSSTDDVRAM